MDARAVSISASLLPSPQPARRFLNSGLPLSTPSPQLIPAIPLLSHLRPVGDIILPLTILVLGWGWLKLMGQPSMVLAAFPCSLPPSSSSQGLSGPTATLVPGGNIPRSQSWRRKASWGRLGKLFSLGKLSSVGLLVHLEASQCSLNGAEL